MRPCEHFEPELSAFLDGELPAREHAAVGAHAQACPSCAAELQRLRAVGAVLRRWDAAETRYATTHAFRVRVLSRLERAELERVDSGRAGVERAETAAAGAVAASEAPRPASGRLLLARAAAAAIVLVAAGAAVSLALRPGESGDLARLEARIEELRAAATPGAVTRAGAVADAGTSERVAQPLSLRVPRLGDWSAVVTPAEDTVGTPGETPAAPGTWQEHADVWEEHGRDRIVQDAFPAYDSFHRERRELELREELRRIQATASAAPERPTRDDAPVTPLGRYLGSLQVDEGPYAPYQQVQIWPIVRGDGGVATSGRAAPLTVDDALAVKALRVREGDGSLVIENRDRRGRSVLVLAGDVFQGGRRDLVAAEDLLLEPGQTRSVRAFGTGYSRRTARRTFTRSDGLALHRVRALLAAGAGQAALDRTVATSLPLLGAAGGDGSLASIFDNDQLFSRADSYVRALLPRLDRDRVVGFAVAVGGDLLGVEVFSDHETLAALRTRVLRSYVLEALARPRLVGESPARGEIVAALRLAGRAANSGTSGEVAAFLEPEAGLGGFGLVTGGLVRHAVVFAGPTVGADAIAAARLRGGFGEAPPVPGEFGGGEEPGTGPGRGAGDTGGGLGTGGR